MTTTWTDAGAYERSMGRWSLVLNRAFVPWLGVGPGAAWIDIGCGTGSLSAVLLEIASPGSIMGVDPSSDFVAAARRRLPGARFEVAPAERLPFADAAFDVAAASLCFHVMPDPAGAAKEMRRVLRPGGVAGALRMARDHRNGGGEPPLPGRRGVGAASPTQALRHAGAGIAD